MYLSLLWCSLRLHVHVNNQTTVGTSLVVAVSRSDGCWYQPGTGCLPDQMAVGTSLVLAVSPIDGCWYHLGAQPPDEINSVYFMLTRYRLLQAETKCDQFLVTA